VAAIIAIVLVVGWHVADEFGMPKETRFRTASFIFWFIVFMCVVQLVRAIYLRTARQSDGTKTTEGQPPADATVKENRSE
jgi:hypothetical protein